MNSLQVSAASNDLREMMDKALSAGMSATAFVALAADALKNRAKVMETDPFDPAPALAAEYRRTAGDLYKLSDTADCRK